MSWDLREPEMRGVLALPPQRRYEHFVKRVADWQWVWGLRDGAGWVLWGEGGRELMPVWPHERYAALCATGAWAGATPASIEAHAWVERWTPELGADRRALIVFPTDAQPGILAEPERLRYDILEELARVE